MSIVEEAYRILEDAYRKNRNDTKYKHVIEWFDMKKSHTDDVVEACKEIIEKDGELKGLSGQIKGYATASSILHDIGRFYEYDGEKCLSHEVDHGDFGDKVLRGVYDFNTSLVNLAVKHHNKISDDTLFVDKEYKKLSGDDKEIELLLLKITKDADKIANLRLFGNYGVQFSRRQRQLYISSKVKNALKDKKLINSSMRETCFDSALTYMAWQFDINYDASFDIIRNEKLNDKFYSKVFDYVDTVYDNLVASGDGDIGKLDEQKAKLIKDLQETREYFV